MSNYVNLNEQRSDQQTTPTPQEGLQGQIHITSDHELIQRHTLSGLLPQVPSRHHRPAYKATYAFRLSLIQILNGSIALLCGMVILAMKTFLYFTGIGLGSGAVFLAAGVFGIISTRQRATWAILTCMVLSIVSAVASGVTIIASSEGIDLNTRGHPFYEINNQRVLKTGLAMDSILIIVSVLELFIAVMQATLCCRVTCCIPGPGRPEIMVVYVPNHMAFQGQGQQNGIPQAQIPASVLIQPNPNATVAPLVAGYTVPLPDDTQA